MGRNLRIALALIILALIGGIAWLFFSTWNIDPVYQGKPLSEWVKAFSPGQPPTSEPATALRHYGSTATPFLAGMLRTRDSSLKSKLRVWLSQQKRFKTSVKFEPAADLHKRALIACGMLGTNVQGTIPALIGLVDDCPRQLKDPANSILALHVLAHMGSNGIPGLMHGLTNGNSQVQYFAARLLGTSRYSDQTNIRTLLTVVSKSGDLRVHNAASEALRSIDQRRAQKIPVSATLWTNAPVNSKQPAANLWDVARGLQVTGTSPLYAGFSAEDIFGGDPNSSSGQGEVIFQDGAGDGTMHSIEWRTPEAVTVRSFGLIAHHGWSPDVFFSRAFRSFTLSAWNENSHRFEPFHSETVAIPYGLGYCGTMLVNFQNLDKPVTASRFRAEFVGHDGRNSESPRVVQLCAFPEPLNLPMVKAAVHNPNPTYQFEMEQILDTLAKKQK